MDHVSDVQTGIEWVFIVQPISSGSLNKDFSIGFWVIAVNKLCDQFMILTCFAHHDNLHKFLCLKKSKATNKLHHCHMTSTSPSLSLQQTKHVPWFTALYLGNCIIMLSYFWENSSCLYVHLFGYFFSLWYKDVLFDLYSLDKSLKSK